MLQIFGFQLCAKTRFEHIQGNIVGFLIVKSEVGIPCKAYRIGLQVLVYKKANNIGYKTAKRRFSMEIRGLAIAMIVVHCGGDPGLCFKT